MDYYQLVDMIGELKEVIKKSVKQIDRRNPKFNAESFEALITNCPYCSGKKVDDHDASEMAICFKRYLKDSTPNPNAPISTRALNDYMNRQGYQQMNAEEFEAENHCSICSGTGHNSQTCSSHTMSICGKCGGSDFIQESYYDGQIYCQKCEVFIPTNELKTVKNPKWKEMFGAESFASEGKLYRPHYQNPNTNCSACGVEVHYLWSDDKDIFYCYKCMGYDDEQEFIQDYDAESFEDKSPMMQNLTIAAIGALALIIGRKVTR